MSRNTSFAKELAEISQIRKVRREAIKEYPKVSVVIATLRPTDLENILNQILKQTLPTFELLLGLHNIDLNTKHKALIKRLAARKITVSHFKFANQQLLVRFSLPCVKNPLVHLYPRWMMMIITAQNI